MLNNLANLLETSPYTSYSYAYPHKTAYRPFNPLVSLNQLWEQERREALFLYLHIPFCEMRCGFCNLFTQTNAGEDLVTAYLNTLVQEAKQSKNALQDSNFARMAIGGGTPTLLSTKQLELLFDLVRDILGVLDIPISVEVSPQTATLDKLQLLKTRGVDRISIGIQSFIPAETTAAGRPETLDTVYTALECLRSVDFPTLNLDLIYGLPGQSLKSWLQSLEIALKFAPEELYLYPLYIRPLTGLGRSPKTWNDERNAYYYYGRDFLLAHGYEQVSMRMFRRTINNNLSPSLNAPIYCCQSDGMVGLGCGARSYTKSLHYSGEYAVGLRDIQAIITNYIQKEADSFNWVNYGFYLNRDEQQRRFIIQSLLQIEGLTFNSYVQAFESDVFDDFSQLRELLELNLARKTEDGLILTPLGMAKADIIGPWLYSPQVKHLMETYQWR